MKKIKMRPKDKNIKATNYDVDLLETLVYEWVRRSIYSKNFRLSNATLKSTANRFKSILNLRSFCVTEEWLQNFRLIYNIKDVFTNELTDIGYKCSKSTLPLDIFNELQPKWESLDPKSLQLSSAPPWDVSEIIDINEEKVPDVKSIDDNHGKNEYMDVQGIPTGEDEKKSVSEETSTYVTNSTELFDIEDELPVCTIFGRKTVANVANIISSNKKYNKVKYEPMIVCTDPKNSNLDVIDKATKEHSLYNSINMLEAEKIKDLMNGKSIDSDSNTSSQNEYQDQYLKEIVRVPENDKNACTTFSNQLLLKPTPETAKYEKPLFKPISMSKLRMSKLKPKPETNVKPSSEAIDKKYLGSKNKLLTKPNRKRKIMPNLTELPASTSLETRLEAIKQPTLYQTPKVDESLTNLQHETINQIPTVVQQTWDPVFATNIITSNFPGETTLGTQASLVAPNTILYTIQLSAAAPNQNHLTMPYISPMTANLQTTAFVQPTTIPPIVLHFHSPMTMQTTEMLPSSDMNLTKIPSISQPSFMPSSIDLTQPTTTTHSTNCIQNQFMQPISAHAHNSLPTEIRTIVTKPSTSTSTTSTHLGIKPSLCPQMTTPTPHIPNIIPTKSEPTKTQCTKTRKITSTITSLTSNSTPSTSTTCIQTTSTLTRPILSAKPPTITSSSSDTALTYCSQKTTPTAYVPNIKPTQTEQTKTKRIQAPLGTLKRTVAPTNTSSTSNSRLITPTAIIPTTATLTQSKLAITTTLVHTTAPKTTPTTISSTLNLSQTITPTTYAPNCIPNKSEPTKKKLMQSSAATRKPTVSSTSTSNSRLTTSTAVIPAATSLVQPTVITKLSTNASSTSNTRPTTTTPTTTTIVQSTTSTKTTTATSSTLPLATTSTAYVPNCIPTQIEPRKLKRIQIPVATKTRTIMSSTINPALTTTTPLQPHVSSKSPTISPTSLMSTSTTSTLNMPISNTNSTPNTKVTAPMEVSINKKTKLLTDAPKKKVTKFGKRAPLKTEEEVVKCIKLMEEFALMNENFRLIGFLERLEQQMHVYKKK